MRTSIAGFECIVENEGQSNCVVLFHGFGADYSDLVPLADFLDPEGSWTWIFPNGPETVDIGSHMTGRAWFPISQADLEAAIMTGVPRDYGPIKTKPPQDVMNDLEQFVQELKQSYEGIVLGGFSQGGMITSHLLSSAGESLKGAVLMSTVLLNEQALIPKLQELAPRPFFQSHGSRDPVLHIKFGQALYSQLKSRGWKGTWIDFPGGHEIPMNVLMKAKDFLNQLTSN